MRIDGILRGAIFGSWEVISVPIDNRFLVVIATSRLLQMLRRLLAIARKLFGRAAQKVIHSPLGN